MPEQKQAMQDFSSLLVNIRNGQLMIDGSAKLTEVMAAVATTQQPGELTLKVKIKPNNQDRSESLKEVAVTYEFTMRPSTFFVDHKGLLTRNDPEQHDLDFEESEQMHGNN